jgi:hypothetical protein
VTVDRIGPSGVDPEVGSGSTVPNRSVRVVGDEVPGDVGVARVEAAPDDVLSAGASSRSVSSLSAR